MESPTVADSALVASQPPHYDIAFHENNPQVGKPWKDRTVGQGDLRDLFSNLDLSQDTLPSEVTARARLLCAKYLGGAWNLPNAEMTIKPITGGMSNYLFLVRLSDSTHSLGDEPRAALLRVHGMSDLEQLLSESVVFTLLSERALGPKLLGVFPGGRFEQYIPSRPLSCQEMSLPKFARLIGPMVARVHTLDVPINKEPEIVSTCRGWLSKWSALPAGKLPVEMRTTKADVPQGKYPSSLTAADLSAELDFMERFMQNSGSPIVFAHNDLQEGNILLPEGCSVGEEGVMRDGQRVDDGLVLIDFEYCNYNYRGFDLGNHFCEFAYDYAVDSEPYYIIHLDQYRGDGARRKAFATAYLEEVYKTRLSCPRSFPSDLSGDFSRDVARLQREGEMFMACSNLFWGVWSLLQNEEMSLAFDYSSYGRDRLALYFEQKPDLERYLSTC